MIKFLLKRLRDALDNVPDDRQFLSEGVDYIQECLDEIRRAPYMGDLTNIQIRCIYEKSEKLRRADLDGKLVTDIGPDNKTKIDAIPNTNDPSKNVTDHVNHRHDDFACDDRSIIEATRRATKGSRTFQGQDLTAAVFDVLDQWNGPDKDYSPSVSRFSVAKSHLNIASASGNATDIRSNLVDAAVQIIRQIDHHDKARRCYGSTSSD